MFGSETGHQCGELNRTTRDKAMYDCASMAGVRLSSNSPAASPSEYCGCITAAFALGVVQVTVQFIFVLTLINLTWVIAYH